MASLLIKDVPSTGVTYIATPYYLIYALVYISINQLFSYVSYERQVVAVREVKNKRRFQARKVVAVAYERWSLIRGSKYSDLTWNLLVFWKIRR